MTRLITRSFGSRGELDAALTARLRGALTAGGASAVMLAGGTTPLTAYDALARQPLEHDDRLQVLFTDERYVAQDSERSNYYQARALLTALSLPAESLLSVHTELPLEQAATEYERQLTRLLSSGVHIGLGLLGLGADGHTASLFTADDLERARGRFAIAVRRPDGMSAVSVTPELLATVREPVFVVAGPDKEGALRALMSQDPGLIAWRAVQGCSQAELWVAERG
jgi:6-phosphogluconolactonase